MQKLPASSSPLRWPGLLAALGLALVATSSTATALTLEDLVVGGASLSTDSGSLTFDHFDAVVSGALSANLGDYTVEVSGEGLVIVGPIGVVGGAVGDIAISFDVHAGEGLAVNGASLFFNGAVSGDGALAAVTEDILVEGTPLADLFVYTFQAGGAIVSEKLDSTALAPALADFRVIKDIQVLSADVVSVATLSVVTQEFAVIPEPGTLLLLGAGLAGLAVAGRSRKA